MKNKTKQVALLSVKQTAERTGYQPCSIRQWVSERRIPHVRLGKAIRIPADALDAFIAENTIPAKV